MTYLLPSLSSDSVWVFLHMEKKLSFRVVVLSFPQPSTFLDLLDNTLSVCSVKRDILH
ncbi:hypothetical protein CSUI_005015 [Cystoisospora suis]|uniref:Uncharacterized protein n=1 Tax=Cystoisospora suis TaxID=483139 RepID=A0A2C6KZF9_9APIC|nr:hypothetical protein CSUI_005015 [Cystoisospora suis]